MSVFRPGWVLFFMLKGGCVKGIVVRTIGSFEKTEVSVAAPGAGEVTVRVEVTGLCRTDLKIIEKGHRDLVLPRIPGEEVIGVVSETGRDVTEYSEGDRVYLYPGTWCGVCPSCLHGAENLCREMQIMGFHRNGGFAEYVTVPVRCLIRVPEGLSPDTAVFAEPLSCCLNALDLAGVRPGMRVGIWGAGPAGTLIDRACRAAGADTRVCDPDARRRERISGLQDLKGKEFDACFIAAGSVEAYREAQGSLASRGRMIIFSGLAQDNSILPVDFNTLHYNEQTLVGAYGCSYRHGAAALDYLESRRIQVDDLISHRFSLWDLEEALVIVKHKRGMKVLLYP